MLKIINANVTSVAAFYRAYEPYLKQFLIIRSEGEITRIELSRSSGNIFNESFWKQLGQLFCQCLRFRILDFVNLDLFDISKFLIVS